MQAKCGNGNMCGGFRTATNFVNKYFILIFTALHSTPITVIRIRDEINIGAELS